MTKVSEDRSHRDQELNPRRWPRGLQTYANPSTRKLWLRIKNYALLSQVEASFLNDVPRLLGEGDYVNLGHARGGSAILLAGAMKEWNINGMVYSIDLEFPDGTVSKLEHFDVKSKVYLLKGSTIEFAEQFKGRDFNFVFIDADHSYGAVKRDAQLWAPLVKPGGLLSFHDTHQEFSHNAIAETVEKTWEEVKEYHVDSIRTFRKPLE